MPTRDRNAPICYAGPFDGQAVVDYGQREWVAIACGVPHLYVKANDDDGAPYWRFHAVLTVPETA